ncbi:hypothetical protein [Nonomuraea indica]|uniref:hypothetical protein n=1 Tax=Nonomuraea indica TaxID=1581193 RepID=UPI000C7D3F5F|nr:hypothetical protein [Nonomuraea indica]
MADPRETPKPAAPLTCEWCRNRPAGQLVVTDWHAIGRRTSLVCDPCGDEGEPDARSVGAIVWRYALTPLTKETAHA